MKTAQQYAKETMDVFWPQGKNPDVTPVSYQTLNEMLRAAYFAGRDEMLKEITSKLNNI